MRFVFLLCLLSFCASAQESSPTSLPIVPQICGNGVIEVGEVCDDGNTRETDGCRRDCSPSKHLPLLITGASLASLGLASTLFGFRLSNSTNGFDAGLGFFILSGGLILDASALVPLSIYVVKRRHQHNQQMLLKASPE